MRKGIIGVLLAVLSTPLFADDYGWRRGGNGRYDDDRYEDDRRGSGRNGKGRRSMNNGVVERTMNDLQRIGSRSYIDGHERDHVRKALNELQEFRSRYQQGRFDNGRLDRAIDSLDHLANAQQLDRRERDLIARRVDDLRSFRARGGRDFGR